MNESPLQRLVHRAGKRVRKPARFRKKRVGFVLSGGGNLGAVQVGMLRALTEAGIKPDLIVGCSVGAINGAGYAAEPNTNGVERLDRLWRRIADGEPDLMPSKFIPVIAQMARKGESLHDQDSLAELLDEELVAKTFSGLKVPFACVATDLETASEYWFDHGRLVPALLASAALPAVYPAVEHRGRTFIDGGVLNEIHAEQAIAMGATELYILHVGHLEDRDPQVQRPFDAAMRAYWIARRYRMAEDLRQVPEHCVVHRLPAGSNPRLRFDDFSQAGRLADLAYDATVEYLRTGHSPEPVSGPVSPPHESDETRDPELDDSIIDDLADNENNADNENAIKENLRDNLKDGDTGDAGDEGQDRWVDDDGVGNFAYPAVSQNSDDQRQADVEVQSSLGSRAFSRWASSAGRSDKPPGWTESDS